MNEKTLKRLIYVFCFLLGATVGYCVYFLHWFSDYTAPIYTQDTIVRMSDPVQSRGYLCYTETKQGVGGYYNKAICIKQN